MTRRRVQRTPQEEEIYQANRRSRNAELQRLRREAARNAIHDSIRSTIDSDAVQQDYLGKMDTLCMHCNAKHFESEKVSNKGLSFNDCCGHGQVKLEDMPEFPVELKNMFQGSHVKSNAFFERIRSYNSSMSFASFNTNLVNFQSRRSGPYCFKIQGQIYYQMNTALYPDENENPSYGQLFIVDSQEAIDYRMNNIPQLDREIVETIDKIIREKNIFAKSYEMMGQEIINQQRNLNENEPVTELQLLFSLKPGTDRRRYNFQRTNEVAAVFSMTADCEIPESYVTIRNKTTKTLQCISTMDPNVEPWIYPLFYPYGTQGWHQNLERITNGNRSRRITRLDYTKYRIAIRDDEFNPFLLGRRLFQQFIVDSYVKVEKDRTNFIKTHQKEIRADTYEGLHDHLMNSANDIRGRIGKTIILPSSFIGSPRHMQQSYQDAMAIVNEKGKPDIFLTMTCNPQWPEIIENLLPGQQACDRPDIVARVFHLKKERLLDLIVKKHYFGKVAAYVYVIEFQKRGLPHMHLLITLAHDYKITTPDIVDKFISAEIPDPVTNIRLHDIVMKNMIHGPCGDWCMVDNKCSKKFPKCFQNETNMDENGYPNYRRRNTGITYEQRNANIVDNRWVVSFSPKLLEIFNCHMNVDVVTSIKSVKYLYKYIYKGHDAANVIIGESNNDRIINHDEVHDYIEARYVSPIEACYRIISKPLQNKSHTVIRLPVHLPNQQCVIISENVNEFGNNLNESSSMLLDYFKLNLEDNDARNYFYKDIPCFYAHKKQKKDGSTISSWNYRQKQCNTIGRMYSVSPTQIELFHLRLLLLHVKGATSYESLRTVNGIIQPTFTAACLALGLIEDDQEWTKAMEEATLWMMPMRLRKLFVRILVHCQPIYPEKLWENFKDAMSEDFAQENDITISYQKAYAEINCLLNNEGRSLANFPSMEQHIAIDSLLTQRTTEAMNHNQPDSITIPGQQQMFECDKQRTAELGRQQYLKLNDEQKSIVDNALTQARADEYDANNCMFIDGPGGTGKTFIYTTLYYLLSAEDVEVCSMAFTGIAAILLPRGKTVHKVFGLPVPMFNDSSSNIKVQSKEGQYLKNVKVFIWDEAPMAPRWALEIVNRTLQHIMGNDLPFGGKIMILGGDFRQLLPIKIGGTRSETVNLCIKFSTLWMYFTKYSLTINMRVLPNEICFSKFLLDIGNGIQNDVNDNIKLPQHCILDPNDSIHGIFEKLIKANRYEDMEECAILSARNIDVDEINKQVTNLLDVTTEHIYTGIDSTENCNNGELTEVLLPEYLNSLNPSCLPPYELRLRKNCIIMLIRNISIHEGLCNGTRLQVIDFSNHLLKCKILTGDKAGDVVFLNRITLYCENDFPFSFSRRQFPIKLAFAMTINKAQGQTFRNIVIDLRRDVFNHGQLYVAMSRVRSWDSLKIYLGNQRQNNKVKNYVYKELF